MSSLNGVRVLEIAHYIAGPYAGALLAQLGADVIKVEPPGGEPGRRALPLNKDGESLYFAAYNAGKRSLTLDLAAGSPDRETLGRLLRWADVLVTNYSPGVPEKLGFGRAETATVNPRLNMVQISGFGSWSDLGEFLSYDGIIQAMSGLASLSGDADGPPQPSGAFICDQVTGIQAAFATCACLLERERTGRGSYVEVSMLRSAAGLLGVVVPQADGLGVVAKRTGGRAERTFTSVFPTSDGHVIISPNSAAMWEQLCSLVGRPELGTRSIAESRRNVLDPELRVVAERAVIAWTGTRGCDEVMRTLQNLGIPCGAVRNVDEMVQDSDRYGLGVIVDVGLANGGSVGVAGAAFDLMPLAVGDRGELGEADVVQPESAGRRTGGAVPPLNADFASVCRDLEAAALGAETM